MLYNVIWSFTLFILSMEIVLLRLRYIIWMYLPIYFWLGIVFKVVLIISIRQSTLSPKRKTFIRQKNPNSELFLQYSLKNEHFHVPQVFLYRISLLLRRISIEHWANIKTRNASDLISKHQRIQLYQSTSKLCLHSSSFFVPSHQEVKQPEGNSPKFGWK